MLSVFILAACTNQIKEEARDRDSTYRGVWAAEYARTPTVFVSSKRSQKCWDMKGNGYVDIAGGRIVARVHGYDLAGFISNSGKFSSEVKLADEDKLVLEGQLDAKTGTGAGQLSRVLKGNRNKICSSKVVFKQSKF